MNKDKTDIDAGALQSDPNGPEALLLPAGAEVATRPIWCVGAQRADADLAALSEPQRAWLEATGWKPEAGAVALLPGPDGSLAGAVLGLGEAPPMPLVTGALPRALPAGDYHFASAPPDANLAALGWLMGAYTFTRYKARDGHKPTRLKLPAGADGAEVRRVARAVAMARDLINTPANDLGPAELADTALALAEEYGAQAQVTVGEALLIKNLPLIHAVGRASDRPPRLIDFTWGDAKAPKITLVGKGICFDTGGLNIKPGQSMAMMKKDMGGAASVLACAAMIMDAKLPVRLRVLVPAADNSISGDAFRPGDVLHSRAGLTVEIGNTDAEGRLVLADALTLADEETPDLVVSFATLTGAARVALGPDLPPLFATDDAFAQTMLATGLTLGDPLWRMPFWMPYDKGLKGKTGDINNIADQPHAGSVVAALFLKRFVKKAAAYAHLDIFAWVPRPQPGRPEGGDPQGARALFETLRQTYAG